MYSTRSYNVLLISVYNCRTKKKIRDRKPVRCQFIRKKKKKNSITECIMKLYALDCKFSYFITLENSKIEHTRHTIIFLCLLLFFYINFVSFFNQKYYKHIQKDIYFNIASF